MCTIICFTTFSRQIIEKFFNKHLAKNNEAPSLAFAELFWGSVESSWFIVFLATEAVSDLQFGLCSFDVGSLSLEHRERRNSAMTELPTRCLFSVGVWGE